MNKLFFLCLCLLYTAGLEAQNTRVALPNPDEAMALKKDISYLSSDELKGRQMGSAGEQMASTYIQNAFKKDKLLVSVQTVEFVKLRMATAQCKMAVNILGLDSIAKTFTLFSEYYPLSQSSNKDSITANWVDCGFGIVDKKTGKDDFGGQSIAGKIAVIRTGYFAMDEFPDSLWDEASSLSAKILSATQRGAVGILFIRGSNKIAAPSGSLNRTEKTQNIPVFFYNSTGLFPRAPLTLVSNIRVFKGEGQTVIGYRNNHKKKTILVCANHDHIGTNEFENSASIGSQEIHNGANNNASGVASLLTLAHSLKGKRYKKNNYLFVSFSGEEMGALGSAYFMQYPPQQLKTNTNPLGKVNYALHLQALGRLDPISRLLSLSGQGSSPAFPRAIELIQTDTHQLRIAPNSAQENNMDSKTNPFLWESFAGLNIPCLSMSSGSTEDNCRPSDDEEKINYLGLLASIDCAKQVVAALNKKGKLPRGKLLTPQTSKQTQTPTRTH